MSLRGSSRRKVISISVASETFLVSGAKFFFLAASAGTVATVPYIYIYFFFLCRQGLEGNKSK